MLKNGNNSVYFNAIAFRTETQLFSKPFWDKCDALGYLLVIIMVIKRFATEIQLEITFQ